MIVVAAGYTVHLSEGTHVSFMCFNYITLPRCSTYLQPGDDTAKWENSIIGAHENAIATTVKEYRLFPAFFNAILEGRRIHKLGEILTLGIELHQTCGGPMCTTLIEFSLPLPLPLLKLEA